ncbi:hypothetical protein [Pseudomonas aeruginosa]|uniref:hypothetical protein n=1 Tax=Pseudomonas aeruginosa TaxID=287 RepID=UPI00397734A8
MVLEKHDEIRPSTFKRPSIGSASNCVACHRDAERGTLTRIGSKYPRLATRVQMSSWLCRSSN